jgi:excinuclease ABC subunit A
VSEFDENLIVSDPSLSLAEGAIEPWKKNGKRMNIFYGRILRRFCDAMRVDRHTPYSASARRRSAF